MIVRYMSLYGCFAGSFCFLFQVTSCLLLLGRFTSAAEHWIGDKSFGGKHLANEFKLLLITSPVTGQSQHLPQVCQLDSPLGFSSAFLLDILTCSPTLPPPLLFPLVAVHLYVGNVAHFVGGQWLVRCYWYNILLLEL